MHVVMVREDSCLVAPSCPGSVLNGDPAVPAPPHQTSTLFHPPQTTSFRQMRDRYSSSKPHVLADKHPTLPTTLRHRTNVYRYGLALHRQNKCTTHLQYGRIGPDQKRSRPPSYVWGKTLILTPPSFPTIPD